MSTEANKALVQRLLAEGFNGGNMALFDELLAPDFVNHDPSAPTAVDREGLKQWWMGMRASFPDLHTDSEALIAEGDMVVKRAIGRGTQTQPFHGFPSTGKTFVNPTISIYRIVDGQVKELWWGYDSLNVLMQLGMIPQPEPATV
ncbi:MAG TPA: ester cyclase [Chloroflexia bacterium]|jgi:steroid delta-isomerase-like uncharacterized protein|nr:ester cyclase [Chloroflexia bacterium]